MTLVTTLVSYRAFVPARSEGTKENTACWQVRLDSRQDDRMTGAGWGRGMKGTSPHNTSLRMESVQFLIICLGHETCLVLSLAAAGEV